LQGEIFEYNEAGYEPDSRGSSKKKEGGGIKQSASPD
jgi:hypothetical protein